MEGPERSTGVVIGGLAVALAVIALRLPLWLLPGPGRDEAAYHYWAHHPEPAFAPLVQLVIRVFELPLGHSLWALRAPVALLGVIVLWLQDERLRRSGSSTALRLLSAAVLALAPGLGFSGSILHPDGFLLASLLALVVFAQKRQVLGIALAASLAALSKPTGAIALPVAWWLIGAFSSSSPACTWTTRTWIARAVLIVGALPLALATGTGLLAAIGEFGHMAPDVSLPSRLGTWGIALLFAGGVLLPWLGIRGGIARVRLLRRTRHAGSWVDSPDTREAAAALATGGLLLAFFLIAAAFRGQFKPNWILPGLVLLLPTGVSCAVPGRVQDRAPDQAGPRTPNRPQDRGHLPTTDREGGRRTIGPRKGSAPQCSTARGARFILAVGLAFSFACSVCQTLVLRDPDIVVSAEAALERRGLARSPLDYTVHAGTREADVSSSATWRARFAEYQDASGFAEGVRSEWAEAAPAPLQHIVSDDYGLAMQLQWYLGPGEIQVTVPGDGVFRRTVRDALRGAERDTTGHELLLLPVHGEPGRVWDRVPPGEGLGEVRHPTTEVALRPYRTHFRRDS
ncbi:MAG: hypothetical protein R3E97_04170 [Candidatus Eisenbacteria bacterium]